MCGKLEIGCSIKEGFQSIVTGQFDALAIKIGELAAAGLQAVATFWMKIDSPTLDPQHSDTGTAASGSIEFLHGHALAVSGAIFTFAILAAGLRMAWEQRGEPLRELLKATMLFVLVATAGQAEDRNGAIRQCIGCKVDGIGGAGSNRPVREGNEYQRNGAEHAQRQSPIVPSSAHQCLDSSSRQ